MTWKVHIFENGNECLIIVIVFMLLDDNSVITAAHCFEKEGKKRKKKIPIGKYQIRIGLDNSTDYRIKVSKKIIFGDIHNLFCRKYINMKNGKRIRSMLMLSIMMWP